MDGCRCVIVRDGKVIARGHNLTNESRNVSFSGRQEGCGGGRATRLHDFTYSIVSPLLQVYKGSCSCVCALFPDVLLLLQGVWSHLHDLGM